ncbi:glycoside hydrolase family 9 protein [Dyella mobilis]|uniref:Glycoside hydrolase family 9 protein n=1 Tax=Dyella mobilis TaxID=1849582 RepID=A0ABS2KAF1_9GAMM|nr:glycoside hydrolase family 9 protein [Dyella mobilis]MBM7128141.1 glycoside hydrolase family 9 protein [Dyella mobilis]GLQ99958.1 endochitinase [Dyella mobilis]
MKTLLRGVALGLGMWALQAQAAVPKVLVDQVGYDLQATKQALVAADAGQSLGDFQVIDTNTDKPVLSGHLQDTGSVAKWGGQHYWRADFSSLKTPGRYVVALKQGDACIRSDEFLVQGDVLERNTFSNVVYYFKGQRASGLMDDADRHLPNPYGKPGALDIHGGWYDATGDYGIHLSHQNLTSYFNTQQVPLVVWSLLRSYQQLDARHDPDFSQYLRRLLDEGLFGADFLVRDKRPDGSFYQSIDAPGPGKLPQDRRIGDPNWRTQIKRNANDTTEQITPTHGPHGYEASFRAGGGVAIAALALASTMNAHGDFSSKQYLQTAEDAYRFLDAHNRELINDHVENIVDDYCALLAATELYRATHDEAWRQAARHRAESLMARLTTHYGEQDYWRADAGTRPFFHPTDAGLPVVALLEYAGIASPDQQKAVRDAVRRSLAFELRVTDEVNNPFGYARELVRMGNGTVRTAFFFPHDTEAAPWWQGENARLASLAAAARMAAPLFADDPAFHAELENYAWDQLHWILGRNPYDTSMLMGSGQRNAQYMFFRSYEYTSAPGAIINGITAGLDDEDGIAFDLGYAQTGRDDDWRWTEQWLPHDAWYLYVVSLPHD